MRVSLLLCLIFMISCQKKIRLSGIIVDDKTMAPLDNVHVSTIKDIVNNKLDIFETKSVKGKFEIEYETFRSKPDSIRVQLSKEGYLTNLYSCSLDKPGDTLVLVRESALDISSGPYQK